MRREQERRLSLAIMAGKAGKAGKAVMAVMAVIMALIVMAVLNPGTTHASDLESSGSQESIMKTTEVLNPAWNKIIAGNKRFKLCLNGAAVLDKETGLVWEKSPSTDLIDWKSACWSCLVKKVGGRMGWRLPTVEELASLVDDSVGSVPYLPSGHPFINVKSDYWSSTTHVYDTDLAWLVGFGVGVVGYHDKSYTNYVWCARGGKGFDGK